MYIISLRTRNSKNGEFAVESEPIVLTTCDSLVVFHQPPVDEAHRLAYERCAYYYVTLGDRINEKDPK